MKKENLSPRKDFIYLEYLPGKEWTVDVLTDRDGSLVTAVPRVRLKTRGGVSVVGKVELNKRVLELTSYIVEKLTFTGPLNIQFKEDSRGEPRLLEINLRFSGGLDITIAAGVNMPIILVDLWISGKRPNKIVIREGIYYKVYNVIHGGEEIGGSEAWR